MSGTHKKRFWILTELFYPDQTSTAYILTQIARALCARYEVHVICGSSSRAESVPESFVHVHRCGAGTTSGQNLFLRALRMLFLTGRLVYRGFRRIGKGEPMLIVTNPAPLMLGVSVLKRIKGSRMTLLVHDVFPENGLAAGIFRSDRALPYRFLRSVFNRAYRSADQLVVLGRDMSEVVRSKLGVENPKPVHVIENWADTDLVRPSSCRLQLCPGGDLAGKIVLQYAGNVGRVQGLLDVVECLHESRNELLHLCIWGTGAALAELRDYVETRQIANVSFHGTYDRSRQNEVLNSCDLAIISLSKQMYGMGVPSKSYNIMAAGKPILFVGDPCSEIALTVSEHRIGYAVANDKGALTAFFRDMDRSIVGELNERGCRARQVAEELYARHIILDKFTRILW